MLTHFTILVSHHVGCRLVHLDMWYLNAIRHQDGCRLVHPSKWDIGQFRVAFMTDLVGESRHVGRSIYQFNSRCQELTNSFTIRLIFHMQLIVKHFNYHIFKFICTFVISFQRYTHSIYSFHIYLVNYQNT